MIHFFIILSIISSVFLILISTSSDVCNLTLMSVSGARQKYIHRIPKIYIIASRLSTRILFVGNAHRDASS